MEISTKYGDFKISYEDNILKAVKDINSKSKLTYYINCHIDNLNNVSEEVLTELINNEYEFQHDLLF